MLSRIFNRIGERTLFIAPSVQEAVIVSGFHYGQMALRLML